MVDMDHKSSHMSHDWIHSETVAAQYRSPEAIMNDIRKRVRTVAIDQERLARSRNKLLSKREHIRTLVKEVQVKRVEAGDAEAAFVTYVRTIATNGLKNTSIQEYSTTLSDLYNRVESSRNDVGVLETDLLQYGRALTGAEIRFQEEENAFYQYDLPELFEEDVSTIGSSGMTSSFVPTISLRPPPPSPSSGSSPWAYLAPVHLDRHDYYPDFPPPPPPPRPSPLQTEHVQQPAQVVRPSRLLPSSLPSLTGPLKKRVGEKQQRNSIDLDGMGKQFDPNHGDEILPSETTDDTGQMLGIPSPLRPDSPRSFTASTTSILRTLSSVDHSDVETERTHVEDASIDLFASTRGRRRSEPVNYDDTSLPAPQLLERSLSESAILGFPTKPAPKHRIRAWLLALLQESKIEKTLYQNILEDTLEEHGFQYPDNVSWEEPAETFWSHDSRSSFEAAVPQSDSGSLGSNIGLHSSDNVAAVAYAPRRRKSTRTNPAIETFDSRALHMSVGLPSNDELDDPSFFPLPRSRSVTFSTVESEDASLDDPCYFPLPRSPTSIAINIESPSTPPQTEIPDFVPLPPSPIAILNEPILSVHNGNVSASLHRAAHGSMPNMIVASPQDDEQKAAIYSIPGSTSQLTTWSTST